jgi:uncharacterized protein YidB (DUF937 family)
MGLLDILNGMQNGPRGQRQPTTRTSGGGGMSPIMMGLLALLAYKAFKGRGQAAGAGQSAAPGRPAALPPGGEPAGLPSGGFSGGLSGGLGDILGGLLGKSTGGAPVGAKPGGSLADMLPGGLGGLLGGAAAGSILTGGLGNLVKELQDRRHGNVAQSWIGTGQNQEIAPSDLEHALGSDTIETLAQHTGLSRSEVLAGLSDHLPELIDQLTPHGRLPTEQEAARMI